TSSRNASSRPRWASATTSASGRFERSRRAAMRVSETCPPSHQRATFASHDNARFGGSRRAGGGGRRPSEALLRAADLLGDRATIRLAQPAAQRGNRPILAARRDRGARRGAAALRDVSRSLRRHARRGRRDFAEPMLRAGRGKAPAAVLTPVVADALTLPLADESCDGAIVAFGIRNVIDVRAAFHEILRVLAPGGRFVVLEFSTPHSALVRWTYELYSRRVLPLVGALISGHPTAYRYLPDSIAQF